MYYYIKNLIGGLLLILAVMIRQEFNLGEWAIFLSIPGWLVLFLGNKK